MSMELDRRQEAMSWVLVNSELVGTGPVTVAKIQKSWLELPSDRTKQH
jgi:hypothetical protein